MTKAQAMRVAAVLKASYPRQVIERDVIEAYSAMLADLDFEEAKAAVNRLVCTSRWFPTVAEIREEAARAICGHLPEPEVAWGHVWRAIGAVGAYRTPSWPWPELAEAVDVLGWRNICHDENVTSTRSRFVDAYRAIRSRTMRNAQLGPHAPPERSLPGERAGEAKQLGDLPRRTRWIDDPATTVAPGVPS